jgi:5-methylcytosine-specific restriction protein A
MSRAPKLCANPQCGELVPNGVRFCPDCNQPRWKATNTPKSRCAEGNWRKKRKRILKRDNHHCQIRYVGICTGIATEVDHITPVTQGGTDDDWNLRAACGPCHAAKSSDEGHRAAGHKPRARITFIPNELRGLPG